MDTATPAYLEPDIPKCLHNITCFSTFIITRACSSLNLYHDLREFLWRVLHASGIPGFDPMLEERKEVEDLKDFYTLFLHKSSSFVEFIFGDAKVS